MQTKEKTMKTKHKPRRFRRFAWANEAVSALEYAILVGIIAVAVGGALVLFGGKITQALTTIGATIGSTSTPAVPTAPAPTP